MLVLTPAQRGLAGKNNGLWADHLPVDSADGADKMVKGVPPWRSSTLSLPYHFPPHTLGRQLWITSHRVDLFVFASIAEAVRNGRYTGVR